MPNVTHPPTKGQPPPSNDPTTANSSTPAKTAAPQAPYKPMNTLNSTVQPTFGTPTAPAFGQASPMRSNLATGNYMTAPPPQLNFRPQQPVQQQQQRAAVAPMGPMGQGYGNLGGPGQRQVPGGYANGNGMGGVQSRDPFVGSQGGGLTANAWRNHSADLMNPRPVGVGQRQNWSVNPQPTAPKPSYDMPFIPRAPTAGHFTSLNPTGAPLPVIMGKPRHSYNKPYENAVAPVLSNNMMTKNIKDLLEDMSEVDAKRRRRGRSRKKVVQREEDDLLDAMSGMGLKETGKEVDEKKVEPASQETEESFETPPETEPTSPVEGSTSEKQDTPVDVDDVADPEEEEEEESEGEEIDEPEKVEGLDVDLLPHQIEGLDWLLSRESAKTKGGILADDMGLGKTIQSIALILSHPHPSYPKTDAAQITKFKGSGKISRCTLIVAPLGLIEQWKSELLNRTTSLPVSLKVIIHHGPKRTSSSHSLSTADVVITTYQTVASEHKNHGPLFAVHFWRTILDEAHTVKNPAAKASAACFALRSRYRWCLTGTPIQNKLEELQSLLRFLRVAPFDDIAIWREQIEKPMKAYKEELAMQRLRAVLLQVLLRRTKTVLGKKEKERIERGEEGAGNAMLNLPGRNVKTVTCQFTTGERAFYDRLANKTDEKLKQMQAGDSKIDYTGALVLLLRLRQACNHPQLLAGKVAADAEALEAVKPAATKPTAAADAELDALANALGEATLQAHYCDVCLGDLTEGDMKSGRLHCADCHATLEAFKANTKKTRTKKPKKAPRVSAKEEAILPPSLGSDSEEAEEPDSSTFPSSKITQLLKILTHELAQSNKCIIFSQFTSMLDLLEPFLASASIPFARYDGKMRNDAREESLRRLKAPPKSKESVPVLLCSLKCGAVGLNLTAASRVVLLEPFWNPAIENQAIDRVHRFGQTKDVVVYKLTIADSVEGRVLELQEAKRKLAEAAIEEGKIGALSKLGTKELLRLFEREVHAPAEQYHGYGVPGQSQQVPGYQTYAHAAASPTGENRYA